MSIKLLIEQNNIKREKLDSHNKQFYERLLLYIRLQNTTERDTEEILNELLDHLLDAQIEGKSAEDVFGDNPKNFADNLIGELPPMLTKERFKLLSMGVLMFGASSLILTGLLATLINWLFALGTNTFTISVGYAITTSTLFLSILGVFFFYIIWYFKWAAFKAINKWTDFFLMWIASMLMITGFIAILYYTPMFGYTFIIPAYGLSILGAILLVPALVLLKRK